MVNKLIRSIALPVFALSITFSGALSAIATPVFASNISAGLCTGSNLATGDKSTDCHSDAQDANIGTIAAKVVNILSLLVGMIAVIMIIYGGLRYIVSGGDSGSVGNAKNTLIYAIVGLVIVALAQIIVHFVLNNTSQALGN